MIYRKYVQYKGFTLVELIVVIAIVAILAAVSIVGFTRYIDNARLSNDTQLASQMTNIIRYSQVGQDNVDLDAHDVRTIIEDNQGSSFDFTPQSDNHGFFYIDDSKEIIVRDYDDVIEEGFELYRSETRLLSSVDIDQEIEYGETPEEMFGSGKFLLSETGSTYALIVSGIRSLTRSEDLTDDFVALKTLEPDMEDFFNLFDPDQGVLYVNNDYWNYDGEEESYIHELQRIVFENGISNIPSFDVSLYVNGSATIKLPKTVKSIETSSFTPFYDSIEIDVSKTSNLKIEEDAFNSSQLNKYNIAVTGLPLLDIVVKYTHYGESQETYTKGDVLDLYVGYQPTKLDFNIEGLPKSELTGMSIVRTSIDNQTYYIVKAYTNEGLIGSLKIPVLIIENIEE